MFLTVKKGFTEEMILDPINYYGFTKVKAEENGQKAE